MKQQNFSSARALTMAELENVNGGKRKKSNPLTMKFGCGYV